MTDIERLIELIKVFDEAPEKTCPYPEGEPDCENCKYSINKFLCDVSGRKADYLLKNGVIVPPCNVGDTVYWLDNEKVKQGEVFEISIHSDGILVHTGIQFCLEVEDVFLTPEEAEKALAERSSNNAAQQPYTE